MERARFFSEDSSARKLEVLYERVIEAKKERLASKGRHKGRSQ